MSNSSNTTFLGNLSISLRIGFLIGLGVFALVLVEVVALISDKALSAALRSQKAYAQIDAN